MSLSLIFRNINHFLRKVETSPQIEGHGLQFDPQVMESLVDGDGEEEGGAQEQETTENLGGRQLIVNRRDS